jgi:hypothetical protein
MVADVDIFYKDMAELKFVETQSFVFKQSRHSGTAVA